MNTAKNARREKLPPSGCGSSLFCFISGQGHKIFEDIYTEDPTFIVLRIIDLLHKV